MPTLLRDLANTARLSGMGEIHLDLGTQRHPRAHKSPCPSCLIGPHKWGLGVSFAKGAIHLSLRGVVLNTHREHGKSGGYVFMGVKEGILPLERQSQVQAQVGNPR